MASFLTSSLTARRPSRRHTPSPLLPPILAFSSRLDLRPCAWTRPAWKASPLPPPSSTSTVNSSTRRSSRKSLSQVFLSKIQVSVSLTCGLQRRIGWRVVR
ncbi:hypothetical protein C8Q74DRAFT_1301411 [Fomes fomentarius]|nr:hypothetical protein C8Q74DRAFT_1301411 [Fomes fomentarius]